LFLLGNYTIIPIGSYTVIPKLTLERIEPEILKGAHSKVSSQQLRKSKWIESLWRL